jgi:hypothetical protein
MHRWVTNQPKEVLMKEKTSQPENREKVFVSHARILTEEQRQSLSDKERDFAASCNDRGVWLELFCPDDACFTEKERVRIPLFCEDPQAGQQIWLDRFCPDGRCEVSEATNLP